MGCMGITEGAIPFATADVRLIPVYAIGSALYSGSSLRYPFYRRSDPGRRKIPWKESHENGSSGSDEKSRAYHEEDQRNI